MEAGRNPVYDALSRLIIEEIGRHFDRRTDRVMTADGKLKLGPNATTGVLPPPRGGWRDHAHNGTDARKLAEANTHETLVVDPATAIHWTREMLQDMIAMFLVDQNGNPFAYNDPVGTLTIQSGAGSAWSVLTTGDPSAPELVFDSFGDVIMLETPR